MKTSEFFNWEKFDPNNAKHVRTLFCTLQCAMSAPDIHNKLVSVQNFASFGDFPSKTYWNELIDKFHELEEFDEGWQEAFDIRDFTKARLAGFDYHVVSSGLTFAQVPIGASAKIFKMEGALTQVPFATYMGGLSWAQEWFDDQQWWLVEDTAIAFRNEAFRQRADTFYALIEAAGAANTVAWQAVTPANVANTNENYDAIRDFNTLNKAAESIITDLKDGGMSANSSSQFLVYFPYTLRARMARMQNILNQGISQTPGLVYNFRFIQTTMLTETAKYYVVLPKRKMKAGIRQNLTLRSEQDILKNAQTAVGLMRYGGAIGETGQCRECSTA
jgi:hypothetical protein